VESYIGGEFFEASFLNTNDPLLKRVFPHIHSPLSGATFSDIVLSSINWHRKMLSVLGDDDTAIPLLGLFKERQGGAGHTFGHIAVKAYSGMTSENVELSSNSDTNNLTDSTDTDNLSDSQGVIVPPTDDSQLTQAKKLTDNEINTHTITDGYRDFSKDLATERRFRPAALRDVLAFPINLAPLNTVEEFSQALNGINRHGNIAVALQGVTITDSDNSQIWTLHDNQSESTEKRLQALSTALSDCFECKTQINTDSLSIEKPHNEPKNECEQLLSVLFSIDNPIALDNVQPATEILPTLVTGAMSHGSLITKTHEAVATAVNMVGGKSNCGEGGEKLSRYNTLKGSKIKQIASGRFGVWTGYLADPMLEELEIKIAQGAKPGEGGQLPDKKVTVEIAALRGGTPRVELVSPPPHHDTYSIEDLAQLIHDAKAARVKVIVKLVSTEGIGTIAVGVAKAGADVINIAGNTGGTGAAQVTSLKHTGRIAELGIAEVHQALCENGFRDKVILRCSNAHQTGSDIVKSAMMGADSFEMGTAALMMLKCVMAKNCNVKCPAGLTTNPEVFDGNPKSLAQYFVNMAHEIREILAAIGMPSLRDIRGRTDLLHLVE
ncbi:MAG: glutamate synthase large subunit, partial [Gammaproteobacteria bacterium]